MSICFIHTADWQIGKPYAWVADPDKRGRLRDARYAVIGKIGALVREHQAQFVLVAGDLFDSATPTRAEYTKTFTLIGELGVPVYVIPGNHDYAGPGSFWQQRAVQEGIARLAPQLRVLEAAVPVVLEHAVLLPCPLLRRHEPDDLTAWIRSLDFAALNPNDRAKPRIVLAHGSVQRFAAQADPGEASVGANFIDVSRLPLADLDYLALGDWHGTQCVQGSDTKAWYAGTPEIDRMPKGEGNEPGHVLVVAVVRGGLPLVKRVRTTTMGWWFLQWSCAGDAALELLVSELQALVGQRVDQDVLGLALQGYLSMAGSARWRDVALGLEAQLLALRLDDALAITPSAEDMNLLTRDGNPLVAAVAEELRTDIAAGGETAAVAQAAMVQLYLEVHGRLGGNP